MVVRQQQAAAAGPPLAQQPPALRPGANVLTLGRPGEGEAGRGNRGKQSGSGNAGKPGKGQQRTRTGSQSEGTSQESVHQSGGSNNDVAEDRTANQQQRGRSSSRTTAALVGPSRTTAGSRTTAALVGGVSVGGPTRPAGTSISTSTGQSATARVTGASAKVTGASAKVTSSQSGSSSQNTTTQAGPSARATVSQSRTTAALVGASSAGPSSSSTPTTAGQGRSGAAGGRTRANSPKKSVQTSSSGQASGRSGERVASPGGQRRRHGSGGPQTAASTGASRAAGSGQAGATEAQAPAGDEAGSSAHTPVPVSTSMSHSGSGAPRPNQSQSASRTNQTQPSTSSGRPSQTQPSTSSGRPSQGSSSHSRPSGGGSSRPGQPGASGGHSSMPAAVVANQKAVRVAAHHRPNGAGHNYSSRVHQRILGFSPGAVPHGHPRYRNRTQQNACTQTPPANNLPPLSAEAQPAADPGSLTVDILDGPSQQQGSGELRTHRLQPGVTQGRPEVNEALPDLLNSHALPPYDHPPRQQNQRRPPRQSVPRSARRRAPSHGTTQLEDSSSSCCQCNRWCYIRCVTRLTTFRYFLVGLAVFGVLTVITGIILGVLNMTLGMNFLTLSLTLTGFGVVLVIVVGSCWKATPRGHEPCHLLFGLGDFAPQVVEIPPNGVASSSRHRRDRNWHGGVVYQEFQHRRPPPSYFASMQEYHQNLARARIQLQNQQPPPVIDPSNANDDDYSLPSSPPPTYKSRASTIRPGLHITFPPTEAGDSPASRPPTYRSHAGTLRRPTLELSAATVDIDTGEQPGSAGSTLHRVNRVVEYLEGVIDSQQQGETANDLAPQATAAASASTESPGEGDRVAADTQL